MEQELDRYYILVKSNPSANIVRPGFKSSHTYYDVIVTRYLYMSTFKSMPPENIWEFGRALNKSIQETDVTNNTANTTDTTNTNKSIEILIGFAETELSTKRVQIEINENMTFDSLIQSGLLKLNLILTNDKITWIGKNGLIDSKTRISLCDTDKFNLVIL